MPILEIIERGKKPTGAGIVSSLSKLTIKIPYKLIFEALLNNLGNLDPFLNHVGTVFKHLEQFFGILKTSSK